ncbi:MAG TPA: CPBP family intramembrane glutamic endopeptidase [Thermoanaerobaculia bacterium]|jgi:membrane protease YdiL (CAAX protease family)
MKTARIVVIGLVAFLIAAAIARAFPHAMRAAHPWIGNAVTKTVMLLEVAIAFAIAKKPLSHYGFRKPTRGSALGILGGVALGALATTTVLACGLTGLREVMKGQSFVQIILGVWIYSSLAEEIFVRGWLQSEMSDVAPRARILISGLLFGSMHLSLLVAGVEAASVAVIVTFTTLLGILCAWLREARDSLRPAFWAHFGFNAGGLLGGILYTIATRLAR